MMNQLFRFSGIAALVCASTFAWSADTPMHKTVNGMDVYYGVVPAEVVQTHVKQHGAERMHGKGRLPPGTHHLVVTLYDAKTAQRITDAEVTAIVIPLGLSHEKRQLEIMKINNGVSYGNYFSMPAGDTPYRIQITISRPSNHSSTSAEFEYRHGTSR